MRDGQGAIWGFFWFRIREAVNPDIFGKPLMIMTDQRMARLYLSTKGIGKEGLAIGSFTQAISSAYT